MTSLDPLLRLSGPATVNGSPNYLTYIADCAGGTINFTLPQIKLNGMQQCIIRNDSGVTGASGTLIISPFSGQQINRSPNPVVQPNLTEYFFTSKDSSWFYGLTEGATGRTGNTGPTGPAGATGGMFNNSQTFLVGGGTTFTVPAGVNALIVTIHGGGGGGGGGSDVVPFVGAGGGGGGAYIQSLLVVNPGQTINVTVGAGGLPGAGPANGIAGVNSSISYDSVTLIAGGGNGGFSNGSGGAGGAGGNASSPFVGLPGATGSPGATTSGGNGGASPGFLGGIGGAGGVAAGNNGSPGNPFGGGGGGGAVRLGITATGGGAGANGVVQFVW